MVTVQNKNGKMVTLLNPSERFEKARKELKTGICFTNTGKAKLDENKKPIRLTPEQRAYRAGVVSQTISSSKAYKAKHPRYKSKKG